MKLDAGGNIEWEKTLSGTKQDENYSAQKTADNGYILLMSTNSTDGDFSDAHGDNDYYVVKLLEPGDTIPDETCVCSDTVHVIVYDTVFVTTHVAVTDTQVIKLSTTALPTSPGFTNTIKAYPNPAKDYLIIDNGNFQVMAGYSIRITNLQGQIVYSQSVSQLTYQISLFGWGGAGKYLLSVINPNQVVVETKILILE